ncbi:hypothetical protein CSUNSWCD_975 [Campylobacter showae CSUNSWCD]|uniref:Uncharacterized protein n=1 Tax=Campylobacter showae CSUNSWCD TaxID=1244083 RepID=M5IP04_9BACT|nr:hypothetical protein CSUNSWCD_975 [Campylobacter showae CSUNSWCD]
MTPLGRLNLSGVNLTRLLNLTRLGGVCSSILAPNFTSDIKDRENLTKI